MGPKAGMSRQSSIETDEDTVSVVAPGEHCAEDLDACSDASSGQDGI